MKNGRKLSTNRNVGQASCLPRRAREREQLVGFGDGRQTIIKIGESRARIASILICEILFVLAFSLALAGARTWLTRIYGPEFARAIMLDG